MTLNNDEILDDGSQKNNSLLTDFQIVGLFQKKDRLPEKIIEELEFELEKRNLTQTKLKEIETELDKLEPKKYNFFWDKYLNFYVVILVLQLLTASIFNLFWGLMILYITIKAINTRLTKGRIEEKKVWKKFEQFTLGINLLVYILMIFSS